METVMPGAEPYSASGGPVGVLLCHGFTGSPGSLRPWAEYLAGEGLTVSLPRLPGHGTTVRDMATTGWHDWYGALDAALSELAGQCPQVVLCGLSMGACLALRLASVHPDRSAVQGLVLVNPSLAMDNKLLLVAPALKYVIRTVPGIASDIKKPGAAELGYKRVPVAAAATLPDMWRTTVADLGKVTAPVLVYRSAVDHVVGPASLPLLQKALPASQVTVIPCPDSYHVATLDNDAPAIFEGSAKFIQDHTA
jgi:carboxylesterase